MARFKVYTNPNPKPARYPIQTVLQGLSGWLKGLLALLFHDSQGSPTSPGPRPKPGALFGGARLREKTDAVARSRAA